jgi:hypothetical protein
VRVLLLLIAIGLIGWFWLNHGRSFSQALAPVAQPAAPPAAVAKAVAPAGPKAAAGGEFSVELTEADLTVLLNQQLAGRSIGETPLGAATIDRLQVALQAGRADATGDARLGDLRVPFRSQMTAQPDGAGRVKVDVLQASVASIALPEAARSELRDLIQAEVDRLLAGQPMRVRSIEIGGGRLRAIGAPGA